MEKTSFRQKISLVFFGLFLCLILLEGVLRVGGWCVLKTQEFQNRKSLQQKTNYRILTLGDSCTAMGGEDSYPSQLERILNKHDRDVKFSVINKGIISARSDTIMQHLKDNLEKFNPDIVIVMMGINDEWDTLMKINENWTTVPFEDRKSSKFISGLKKFKVTKLFSYIYLHLTSRIEMASPKRTKASLAAEFQGNKSADYYRFKKSAMRHLLSKDYSKAREIFEKALAEFPHDDFILHQLAICAMELKNYPQAKIYLTKALEVNPDNTHIYAAFGRWYTDQEMYDDAILMFEKAIAIQPQNSGAYYGVIFCYYNKKDYYNLFKACDRAVKANPGNNWFYGLLATLTKEQGDADFARKYLREAKRLRSSYYIPTFAKNYRKLIEVVKARGGKVICMQYPLRPVAPLKKMLKDVKGLVFVSNEETFKKALEGNSYSELFTDMFAGDFGHATPKGNQLIAEKVAAVIIQELF